jgi:DNA topoisomerase-1
VPLTEDKVNDYLRSFGATAKQFRTYHASRLAAEYLAELGVPSSDKAAEKNIADAVARTARVLGNTPAVCRGSYINPAILDAYRKGVTMTHPHHQEMGVPA